MTEAQPQSICTPLENAQLDHSSEREHALQVSAPVAEIALFQRAGRPGRKPARSTDNRERMVKESQATALMLRHSIRPHTGERSREHWGTARHGISPGATDPLWQLSHRSTLFTMRFTLATVINTLPFFVAAVPQPAKQRGTAIPLSKLSSLVNADQSVGFEALNSHIALTTALKNTGASHPSAVKGARKRDSSGLPLASLRPLKPLFRHYLFMFDTGSRDVFLIWCIDCDDSCNGHAMYDPEASLSSIELGKPFSIDFVGGNGAFGYQYIDNVMVVRLTATHQTLGAAVHYSEGFQIGRFPGDGLLGMASQAIPEYDASPLFQTLVTDGQTDELVFAFNFAAPRPELYLGGTNPDMYTGDFTWAPVIQHGYWQINMVNVVGNGRTVLTSFSVIIDTGTLLILGPLSDVVALCAGIGGTPFAQNFYSFPCNAVPSVSFTFDVTFRFLGIHEN
ncbi:acid protease [Gyrodon lividus]|nr:acid protease [Gyrodon lividus]